MHVCAVSPDEQRAAAFVISQHGLRRRDKDGFASGARASSFCVAYTVGDRSARPFATAQRDIPTEATWGARTTASSGVFSLAGCISATTVDLCTAAQGRESVTAPHHRSAYTHKRFPQLNIHRFRFTCRFQALQWASPTPANTERASAGLRDAPATRTQYAARTAPCRICSVVP